ncbi:hypothetical protein CLF_113034, partial [Clonorchis sinensis]
IFDQRHCGRIHLSGRLKPAGCCNRLACFPKNVVLEEPLPATRTNFQRIADYDTELQAIVVFYHCETNKEALMPLKRLELPRPKSRTELRKFCTDSAQMVSGARLRGSTEIIFEHYRLSGPLPFLCLSDFTVDWLRQKASKRTLGLLVTLSSPSAVQKVLGRAVSVQKANPTIRRISEDRPLDARKLGHSSSREEVRKKLPDGANSADPKLKAKPIVVIAPCAPESTPRQTTATPDSSFYSTTADPSNSKGSDALEEASFTWTERPKSALGVVLYTQYTSGVSNARLSNVRRFTGMVCMTDQRLDHGAPLGKALGGQP